MSIDDPIEATKNQWKEQPDRALEVILEVAGTMVPFAGIVNVVRKYFSADTVNGKVEALLRALENEVRRLGKKLESLSDKLESPEFAETLVVAVTETIRTTSNNKIQRFGSILGLALASDAISTTWDDAASYIRDISQLGEEDIQALRILYSVQKDIYALRTYSTDPNPYTEKIKEVVTAVDRSGLSRDDFYSRCSRLSGFGLALEVQRNDGRMSPGDHCFRLTKRGVQLLELIKQQ